MDSEKNMSSLTSFFSSLFHNFPRLLLANLFFAVPFAVFFAIFWLINTLTGADSMFILFLTIIPLFPFYAGITQVTSHMVRGEKSVNVPENFLKGVKDNFLRFLIYGVLFYIAVVFSYYSVILYIGLGSVSGSYYVLLAVSVIIILFIAFAFFYIPPMTVTFDLSFKNVLKNSALMTFGELKHNLIALFGIFIIALVCATVLMCCVNAVALIIATVILAAFIVPSVTSFVINSAVYKGMYTIITNKNKKIDNIDKKIENRRNGIFYDEKDKPDITEGFEDIDVDETKDGNEYIFYNGKMVKRSVLIKQKNSLKQKEDK